MYTQDQLKELVAQAAKDEVLKRMPAGQILGVGTGSTANLFIDAIAEHQGHFKGAVSSSEASTARLIAHGFKVFDANEVEHLSFYVDGADEIDLHGHMLKGGGGALTREKIVAQMAQEFICICDASKEVSTLGRFPLPVEVIPMATQQISEALRALGGQVTLRRTKDSAKTYVTDNQGWILDVAGLSIQDPVGLESVINQMPGVICNGLFARRKANVLLLGGSGGVTRKTY